MYQIGPNDRASLILTGLLFCSASARALNIEPGIGVGLEYTNNAAFAADTPDLGDRLHRAEYVAAVVDYHQACFILDAAGDLLGVDESVGVERDQFVGDHIALL